MHIVHASAELAPVAKVGGLGDVVLGLSRALKDLGHEVEIILPKYPFLAEKGIQYLGDPLPFFTQEGGKTAENKAFLAEVEGCKVWFLESHHPEGYFQEKTIYAGEKDIARYLYFCRMALDFLEKRNISFDVLHLHDWHTAMMALLYREFYRKRDWIKRIVLNIHNLEYQGKCSVKALERIHLEPSQFLEKLKDDIPQYPDSINLLKGGILYADKVIAVSPNYAKEILTVEKGCGLEKTLRYHEKKLGGILNGIDLDLWNPEHDPHIAASYSSQNSLASILEAKAKNKEILQRNLGLKRERLPLIGCISRLVPQKGPELIKAGILFAASHNAQAVLLGSSSLPDIQKDFETFQKTVEGPNVHLHFTYDEDLSRLLYAASDFILVPSVFEPCGLTQLIALRYGAVPIVRRTGGLADTVFDQDRGDLPEEKKNGYTFDEYHPDRVEQTLERALSRFLQKPQEHQALLLRGLKNDFGWKASAQEYVKLYSEIL